MTYTSVSLLPLEVCYGTHAALPTGKKQAYCKGVSALATFAVLAVAALLLALCDATLAASTPLPAIGHTGHTLLAAPWSPPPDGTNWVYNEAQLGLPNAPFIFPDAGLYTAGSFESSREFHIDQNAVVHTDANTILHLSGPILNLGASTQGLAKYGSGTLTLSGQNRYKGNTALYEGTLRVQGDSALGEPYRTLDMHAGTTLDYAPGAIVYNAIQLHPAADAEPGAQHSVQWRVGQGTATQAGTVVGAIPIVKQGAGTLHLTGFVTNPSLAVVDQGSLAIGGFFAGPVRVRHGARLEGGGAVESATLQSGATLAPGMQAEPGLMVIRNLRLDPGATLEINALPNGQADSVQVLETARLAGQVLALAQPGEWQAHTRYTIVQAEQGFDNTRFDSAAASLPFLDPQLSYDDQRVYLSLVRPNRRACDLPHPHGCDPNQRIACKPFSAMTFSSLSAGPAGRVSPCSHLRTVEAEVCKCSANTGWLNLSPSRRCLISAALNSRTGGGQIASNSRIVTLPSTPAS